MSETLVRGWTTTEPDPATLEPTAWPVAPAGRDLSGVTTERLEEEICVLAGHLAAATGSWLGLVAEFDRRNGWAGPGLQSCAQWLAWKVGMSLHTAREHVRVARALITLPLVRTEMATGRLSYAKARAITRIADSFTETALVEIGLSGTATHVEKVVAGYRRAARATTRPSGKPARSVSTHWDDDGSLIVRARLAPEEGALYLAAIEAMRHQHATDAKAAATADGADDTGEECQPVDEIAEAYKCSHADAFVAMATSALEHGPVDHSGADRFQVIIHADLDQLLDDPNEETDSVDEGLSERSPEEQVVAGRRRLLRGRCQLGHDGPCLHPTTLHRILCDTTVRVMVHDTDGTPMDQGRRQRLVTTKLRRALDERDHGQCQFPGCDAGQHLHAHHILAWHRGGKTDLANLILLCGFHHRLLHEHGYSIETVRPGTHRFHRPDGTAVLYAPPSRGDPRLDRLNAPLHEPPPITPSTTTPNWGGDRLDLGYAVSLLFPPERETAA